MKCAVCNEPRCAQWEGQWLCLVHLPPFTVREVPGGFRMGQFLSCDHCGLPTLVEYDLPGGVVCKVCERL